MPLGAVSAKDTLQDAVITVRANKIEKAFFIVMSSFTVDFHCFAGFPSDKAMLAREVDHQVKKACSFDDIRLN